jgi:hypothetical protein
MILKLIELALLASIAVRLLAGKWPWELWQANDRSAAEKRARNLLGVVPAAGRDDIIDAHRRLIARVHPDKGGTAEAVHEANAARDVLLARLGVRDRG